MVTNGYLTQPLTAHTWDAFAGLVERHNGIFGGCWCTYFHPGCAERKPGYDGSRALKKRLVEVGQAHAALVMIGDEAIAWAQYGSPDELPNIHHRKQYLAEPDVTSDYRITCIFVDKRYRRQDYAKVALAGALDQIAAQGGGVVEGYPHDVRASRLRVHPLQGYEEHRYAPHDPAGLNLPNRPTLSPDPPSGFPWSFPSVLGPNLVGVFGSGITL